MSSRAYSDAMPVLKDLDLDSSTDDSFGGALRGPATWYCFSRYYCATRQGLPLHFCLCACVVARTSACHLLLRPASVRLRSPCAAIAKRVLLLLTFAAVSGVVLFNVGLSTFKGT